MSYVNADGIASNSATSLTIASFTLSSTERMLAVGATRVFGSSDYPTGVTVGGNSMTGDAQSATPSIQLFYLGQAGLPANGTPDIVGTWSGADEAGLSAVLHDGVKDQAPESSNATSGTNGTSFSITDDTVSANAQAMAFFSHRFNEAVTNTGDFTVRTSNSDSRVIIEGSSIEDCGAASTTLTHSGTWSTNRDFCQGIIIFEKAAAATSPFGYRPLLSLGVGA